MKVALVCDWLTNVGGAEKVLLEIHRLFPDAPIYTSQYNPNRIGWFRDADVRVGWMRIFPAGWRKILGVFRLWYFKHLDLSDYDLVISVTGAEAKAVKTKKRGSKNGAVHISYCHVPTQYYWQMYDEYLTRPGFGILNPLVKFCFKMLVKPLRKADYKAAQKVDQFVTISDYAREQILKYYGRMAVVVHPPVEVTEFARAREARMLMTTGFNLADAYVVTSRQVTWKRIDLCIKACLKLKRPLLIIGEGEEHGNLMRLAGGSPLIKFLPLQNKKNLARYLAGAKGYLFPSLEPFGIAPVEAMAAGCPVVALGEGGARDYVIDGVNGVLFKKQTVKDLAEAILRFEEIKFSPAKVAKSVEKFSVERFDKELMRKINDTTL